MATVNEGGFNQPQWFKDLVAGIKQGIAASPEDRREALTAIRELEGKSEVHVRFTRWLKTLSSMPFVSAIPLVRSRDCKPLDYQGSQMIHLSIEQTKD